MDEEWCPRPIGERIRCISYVENSVGYRNESFDISKYRYIVSNLFVPHLRVVILLLTLNESFGVSNIEIVSITSFFFVYRYRIELNSDMDIRHPTLFETFYRTVR